MKNILVTGGMGFIGSHLASALLKDVGTRVFIVDNLATNVIDVDKIVAQITKDRPGQLEVRLISVRDIDDEESFDEIYHLASVVGPAAVLDYAGYITEKIVTDTYQMMRLAMRNDARLINVSTSEIYGGGENGFCSEDTPRVVPPKATARLEYAAGKMAAEVAIENLCGKGDLNAITIRPFNVSGVRQVGTGGFVLPRFIGQALCDLPLTVFGDGAAVRAFTDVRDVVSGILTAANSGVSGEAYNVGNPDNRTTIRSLANRVVDITKSNGGIAFIDPKTIYGESYAEAHDKFPDASKLLKLGWEPRYSLDDTIRAVYDFMREMPREEMQRLAGVDPVTATS